MSTQLRRARKPHPCTGVCGGYIRAGEQYLAHTEFPGGEGGYADAAGHPVRLAECYACAVKYGREYLFPEGKDEWAI